MKLTRYKIESITSEIMSNYNYGDCYPLEILELENIAELKNYTKDYLIDELINIIHDLDLEAIE